MEVSPDCSGIGKECVAAGFAVVPLLGKTGSGAALVPGRCPAAPGNGYHVSILLVQNPSLLCAGGASQRITEVIAEPSDGATSNQFLKENEGENMFELAYPIKQTRNT